MSTCRRIDRSDCDCAALWDVDSAKHIVPAIAGNAELLQRFDLIFARWRRSFGFSATLAAENPKA